MLQGLMQDMNAVWWLLIVLAVVVGLFFIALKRKPQDHKPKNKKPVPSIAKNLLKLSHFIKSNFPEYEVSTRNHHLLLAQQGKKLAMLTMDKRIEVGSRDLGGVKVINLHTIPTKTQMAEFLATVQ